MTNNTIKAVIFDVGGVLIQTRSRVGRQKWAAKLGIDPWEFENLVFNGESGRQAQLGRKSAEAHWLWLADYFGLDEASSNEMRRDFFAGDALNESLLAEIKQLRQVGYRTGLLSNFADDARQLWNETYLAMAPAGQIGSNLQAVRPAEASTPSPAFIDYFDGIVISCEVGLMKPDPRIYYLAAESLGVKTEEALFIDDFIENVEGARRTGMQAIHFTGNPFSLLSAYPKISPETRFFKKTGFL